jgi:glycosyltransferase 2 family protein
MKRVLTTTLQIAITIALLWWIFHDPSKRARMAEALKLAELWWFLPGLALFAVVLILQTHRWHLLLRAIGIRLQWMRTWKLVMIGMFFNLFLLGSTGGDVVKIFYAMREAGKEKAAAFLSIVLDRIMGLLALAFVSVVVVIWKWDILMSTADAKWLLATIALILGGSLGVIAAAVVVAALRLENRLPERLPLRRGIVDLAIATRHYVKAPLTLVAVFGISVAAHLLMFSTFYFSALAFKARLSFADICSVMPIVNTITAMPISLQGVGWRETLFERLLALYGTPEAVAVLISISGYLISVAWSLVGGVIFMCYRPSDGKSASLKEMQEATDEVAEHPAP